MTVRKCHPALQETSLDKPSSQLEKREGMSPGGEQSVHENDIWVKERKRRGADAFPGGFLFEGCPLCANSPVN